MDYESRQKRFFDYDNSCGAFFSAGLSDSLTDTTVCCCVKSVEKRTMLLVLPDARVTNVWLKVDILAGKIASVSLIAQKTTNSL